MTRSIDCAALQLREIAGERSQTLLTPFDRPAAIDGHQHPWRVGPRRWLHELDRALLRLHPFGAFHAAAGAPIRLLPYQLEPALAVLRDGASRLLIADGVGLGKTIEAGLLLLELAHRHELCRALVLTPAGLRDQWLSELSARFGLAPVLADSTWLKSTSAERPAHVNPWSLPGIYLASHDLVKRPEVLRPLEDVTWDAVVIDEAHAVSPGTDRRAAIHAIAVRSRHVVLLTATPPSGDPAAFEALCRIGGDEPIVFFQRSRAEVAGATPRKTTVLSVAPSAAERRMHDLLDRYSRRLWHEAGSRGDDRARLVSILLRKRALSSAGSLGASVQRRLTLLEDCRPTEEPWQPALPLDQTKDEDALEDDEPSAVLSTPGLADPKRERRWLTAILDAARVAAGGERKMRFLSRLLAKLGEPAIVFTEYRDTLARLEARLAAAGHPTTVLHGGLTPGDRSRVQRAFNERGGTLLATDAASEGLNLHSRCRVVIHFELPWSPSRLEQRAGRVDRLGQTRRVHEVALVAAHTAERLVVAPLVVRASRIGAARGRMLDALTESRVAAAVMTGTPVAHAFVGELSTWPANAAPASEDLGGHAVAEAARLEHCRRLRARSRRDRQEDSGGRPVVSRLPHRARVARGLFLVFSAALVAADGRTIHAEPCLVHLELERSQLPAPGVGRLNELIAALISEAGVPPFLALHYRERFSALALLEVHRRGSGRAREAALGRAVSSGQPSAARMLVQAGLFDRRALRAAASQIRSVTAHLDELSDRAAGLADSAPPTSQIDLVAALLVPSR